MVEVVADARGTTNDELDHNLIKVARNIGNGKGKGQVMYDRFKFVCHGLPNFPMDKYLKNDSTLCDIYFDLKNNYFNSNEEAFVFVYEVLDMIEYSPMPPLPESLHGGSCNVRETYSDVNLRVTALKLIGHFFKREKETLKSYLREVRNVPSEKITSDEPAILAAAMFDEGVVTNPARLHVIAECFNRGNITASLGNGGVIADDELRELRLKLQPYVNKMKRKYRLKCFLKALFALFVITFIALLISTVCLISNKPGPYSDQYNITDNSTILLDIDGYSYDVNKIEFMLLSNDREANIAVYQWTGTSSNLLSLTTKSEDLSPHVVDPSYTGFFKRQPLNYNGGDNPIYGVTGTQLKFLLVAWSLLATPSCLKIRVFRNQSFYNSAVIENGETNLTVVNGVIDHSHCLPVGTHDSPANATWSYTFNETGYVFVSFDEGSDTHILGGRITGTIKIFDTLKLTPVCFASIKSKLCALDVCGRALCLKYHSHSYTYAFLKSDGVSKSEVGFKVTKARLAVKEFILVLVTGLFLILTSLYMVCCILAKYCSKCLKSLQQTAKGSGYRSLPEVTDI